MQPSDWDYRGIAAASYDLWFGAEPFWDQGLFQRHVEAGGGKALEIACGTGRLLLPFLRDGLVVEGVDSSEEMLALCRRKAAALGLAPVLHHQRMQELSLPERYRTLFVPACSFQILARREEAMEALRRFRAHLEPGGTLVLTLFVPWRDFALDGQWRLRRSGRRPEDGARILIHECTRSDRVEQLQFQWLRFEVFRGDELVESTLRTHRLRWYHRHEFDGMLRAAGFRDVGFRLGTGELPATDPEAEFVFSARV